MARQRHGRSRLRHRRRRRARQGDRRQSLSCAVAGRDDLAASAGARDARRADLSRRYHPAGPPLPPGLTRGTNHCRGGCGIVLLAPVDTISTSSIAAGKRALIHDGAWANVVGALTSGVLLVGFALALGASDQIIGILAAIPFIT